MSTIITGGSFTGFTVTVNTWLSDNSPSDTDAVNVSKPFQFSKPLNVNVFPSWDTVILTPVDIEIDKPSVSTSVHANSVITLSSSLTVKSVTLESTGASFTGLMVILIVPSTIELLPKWSVTENVTESEPL